MEPIVLHVPEHFDKFVELSEANELPAEDVVYKEAEDPADDSFEILLDSYNFLGNKIGKHRFALTVGTLLEQRNKIGSQLEAAQTEYDAFCDKIDRIIAALQKIKNEKKAHQPLTSPEK